MNKENRYRKQQISTYVPTRKTATWKRIDDVFKQNRYNLRSRPQQLAQHIFQYPTVMYIFNDNGKRLSLDTLLSLEPDKWEPALSNEWGRLSEGNDAGVEYTNTIEFIFNYEVPQDKKIIYASFVCDFRPLKDEKWRVRLVVGGDKLPYEYDAGSPATDLNVRPRIYACSVQVLSS